MNGEMAYTDETLKPVFEHWEELIKEASSRPTIPPSAGRRQVLSLRRSGPE